MFENRVLINLIVRMRVEEQTGKDWNRIVAPKDQDIESLVEMIADLQ